MILVATGLKREARILGGPSVQVVAGGGDRGRLELELEGAAGEATALISMGLCGALATGLRPGDCVVATEIIYHYPLVPGDQRKFNTHPEWTAALARALPNARSGPMLASDIMIADARGKATAYAATGALAVDMESHVAAAVAARHGLPFAAVRVVSDAADRSLPAAAQAGMAADGGMDVLAVIKALAADLRQLPALIRIGAEAEAAFQALRRGRDLLGPGLGRPDLGELPLDVP
jgi:adenosylhomocysteine nucleosidase